MTAQCDTGFEFLVQLCKLEVTFTKINFGHLKILCFVLILRVRQVGFILLYHLQLGVDCGECPGNIIGVLFQILHYLHFTGGLCDLVIIFFILFVFLQWYDGCTFSRHLYHSLSLQYLFYYVLSSPPLLLPLPLPPLPLLESPFANEDPSDAGILVAAILMYLSRGFIVCGQDLGDFVFGSEFVLQIHLQFNVLVSALSQ